MAAPGGSSYPWRQMSSRAPRPSWTHLPALKEPPPTVLDWLTSRFPRVPRNTWVQRMDRGLVTNDQGVALKASTPYLPHLRLAYYRELEDEPMPPVEIRLVLVDNHLVIADKPPFLPVVPGGKFVRHCLLYLLEERLGIQDLAPVHRLDRATSGLVVFARKPSERGAYGRLFAEGKVQRGYLALAQMPETPKERHWQVSSRLVRGTPFFRMEAGDGEDNAFTTVELQHSHAGWGHFQLRPESGKKHQLRLHMASLGWPIFGDRYYPELLPEIPDDAAEPLRLVAKTLSFEDPFTHRRRYFESQFDLMSLAHWQTAETEARTEAENEASKSL